METKSDTKAQKTDAKIQTVTKFKRQFDPTHKRREGLSLSPKSMTVPDQHISVRQLLINHTRGIPNDVKTRNGIYTGDVVAPRLDLDMVEQLQMKEQLIQDIEDLNKKIEDERQQSKKDPGPKKTDEKSVESSSSEQKTQQE